MQSPHQTCCSQRRCAGPRLPGILAQTCAARNTVRKKSWRATPGAASLRPPGAALRANPLRGPGPQGSGVPHVTPQGAFSHSSPWRRLEGGGRRAWRCRRNGSVVRPDGRRGAATPGPAGPAFGPEGGPKEEERPEAAPADFRRSLRSRRRAAPVARLKRFGAGAERGRVQTHPPCPLPWAGGAFPPRPQRGAGKRRRSSGRAPDSGARFPRDRVGASVTATRHRWGRLGSAPPIARSCLGPGGGRAALDRRG